MVSLPLRPKSGQPASPTKLQVLKRFEFESRLMRSGVVAMDSSGRHAKTLLFVRGAPAQIEQLIRGGVLPPDYQKVACSSPLSCHGWCVVNLYTDDCFCGLMGEHSTSDAHHAAGRYLCRSCIRQHPELMCMSTAGCSGVRHPELPAAGSGGGRAQACDSCGADRHDSARCRGKGWSHGPAGLAGPLQPLACSF